jgi:hypothetical protein
VCYEEERRDKKSWTVDSPEEYLKMLEAQREKLEVGSGGVEPVRDENIP